MDLKSGDLINNNLHNDIIDWNVNQFYKESNESHQEKAHAHCTSDLSEF